MAKMKEADEAIRKAICQGGDLSNPASLVPDEVYTPGIEQGPIDRLGRLGKYVYRLKDVEHEKIPDCPCYDFSARLVITDDAGVNEKDLEHSIGSWGSGNGIVQPTIANILHEGGARMVKGSTEIASFEISGRVSCEEENSSSE